jgi:acyl-CoA thioester hydrolase
MLSGEIQIRVRYAETDRGGLLHHANYLVYLEQARTELLRSLGASYKDMEDQGFYLVVSKAELKFKAPIFYDDVVTIRTTVTRTTPVRIEHAYTVHRPDGQVACEAATTLACIDKAGKLQPMPGWLSGAK